MAIMWDALVKHGEPSESTSAVAWRLRLAQMLVASGWDAAVVREALVPEDGERADDDADYLADVA